MQAAVVHITDWHTLILPMNLNTIKPVSKGDYDVFI